MRDQNHGEFRMDNLVTAKYFQVSGEQNTPDIIDVFSNLNASELKDREKDINPGEQYPIIVRLERLEGEKDGFVVGELIRKQTQNLPPEASDDGLQPITLSEGGGLAYPSAFVYHPETKVILIQSNPIAVSYSRLAHYLMAHDVTANFRFDPVPNIESWQRFNSGLPRKFTIRIASPEQVDGLPETADTVAGSAANIAEATRGAYVTIEVSMGTRRGSLAKESISRIIRYFSGSSDVDVRSLSASVKSDGSGTDVIDFLKEFLFFKDVFDLPDKDAVRNYEIRRDALRTNFRSRLAYIRSVYGS